MIEALILKNYSKLIDDVEYKKQIIKKSLFNTPYDVDLWKINFRNEEKFNNYKAKEIVESGYLDKELLSKLKVEKNNKRLLVKILLSFYNSQTIKDKLIPLLSNGIYSKYIDIIFKDSENYLGDGIYELF